MAKRQSHLPTALRAAYAPTIVCDGQVRPAGFRRPQERTAIDDRITAPSFGFGNAENYYHTQSAMRYLEGLRVPVLLIYSKDDTLVPSETFDAPAVRDNPGSMHADRAWRTLGIPGPSSPPLLAGYGDHGVGEGAKSRRADSAILKIYFYESAGVVHVASRASG
jgi:pimeloyl-ACP methyl ester carboxylesterase